MFTSKYGHGFNHFDTQEINIISYYHWAFEDYLSRILAMHSKAKKGINTQTLIQVLEKPKRHFAKLSHFNGNMVDFINTMASYSVTLSGEAGRASLRFFPAIKQNFITFDPNKKMTPQWWAIVIKKGEIPSKAQQTYTEAAYKTFEAMGVATRAVVKYVEF